MAETTHATGHYDGQQAARWQELALPYLVERDGLELDRPAVVFEDRVRTYGDLRRRARRIGNALLADGLGPLERVAVLTSNRLEFLEIELGIAMARGIMVPLNWRLHRQELAVLLAHTEARVAFVEDRFLGTVQDIIASGDVPSLRSVIGLGPSVTDVPEYDAWCAQSTEDPVAAAGRLDDPHEIIFTSGTTGRPKGAIWTNGTVMWNAIQQVMDFGLRPHHSTYAVIDSYYIGGRHNFTWPLLHQGATVHLRRSSGFDAAAVLDYVVEHSITHVLWVPTMLYDILRLSGLAESDTSCLEMIMSGGAPVPLDMLRAAATLFPSTNLYQVYGLTEGGGSVSLVRPEHAAAKLGSCGRPSMHNRIRIAAPDGGPCTPGEAGEILVKGPAVTAGYWGEPELTAQTVVDGWLHTGDLGYLDEDGYLYVSGRKKDMMISGGMNIYPAEIEAVLQRHPAVVDAAVVGVPDERWGESVCAVVQPVPGQPLSEREVIDFCAQNLAGFKKPKRVVFVDELPRTVSGKIQKFVLRDRLARPDAAPPPV